MRKIEKNKKISMLLSLIAILSYSNYIFASTGAIIQNTNPIDTGSGQWPNPRFELAKKTDSSRCSDADYDRLTGLMWVKDGYAAGAKNWADAKTYADTLSLCGYNDWRLPTVNELVSLVNYSGGISPAHWLNTNGFNNIQEYYYWSSTVYYLSGGTAGAMWTVGMNAGYVGGDYQTNYHYVLPVRGPN